MTLTWREATKADRPALRAFTCTDPAPRQPGQRPGPHPRPWEQDVQKAIHTLPVPISGDDGVVLLGLEDDRIVAVLLWSSVHDQPDLYKIRILAITRD